MAGVRYGRDRLAEPGVCSAGLVTCTYFRSDDGVHVARVLVQSGCAVDGARAAARGRLAGGRGRLAERVGGAGAPRGGCGARGGHGDT